MMANKFSFVFELIIPTGFGQTFFIIFFHANEAVREDYAIRKNNFMAVIYNHGLWHIKACGIANLPI